jgi:hypothetical protein
MVAQMCVNFLVTIKNRKVEGKYFKGTLNREGDIA